MYFNYTTYLPNSWWERRSFLHAWWRLYAGDRQWAPPVYTALSRLVRSSRQPSLHAAEHPDALHGSAAARSSANTYATNTTMNAPVGASMTFEEVVSATLIQIDRRRDDDAAYLGLLRCANDEETLERLLGKAFEQVAEQGCSLLLGPTGILPGWNPGALVNHYQPPPALAHPLQPALRRRAAGVDDGALARNRAIHAGSPGDLPPAPTPAVLEPLALPRLAGDLLPLLVESTRLDEAFPDVRPTRSGDPDRLAAGGRAARGLASDGRRHASGVHHAAGGPGTAAAAYGWRQALAPTRLPGRCAVILA